MTGRPATGRPRFNTGGMEIRLADEARRIIDATDERKRQRQRVIAILALAHVSLAIAVAPGYLQPQPAVIPLSLLGATAFVALVAFLASRLAKTTFAAYILVFGGGLVTAALTIATALTGDAAGAAQIALFLLVMIVEAGLLCTPEVTLLVTAAAAIVTAGALAAPLSSGRVPSLSAAYLLMVYSLALEGLVGLGAWLVAQFIFESATEVQRSHEQNYALAQTTTRAARLMQQQEGTKKSILEMQATITRVVSGESTARAQVFEGDLADLTRSFNLLLDQLQPQLGVDYAHGETATMVRQMMDIIGRMSDDSGYTPNQYDPIVQGPLGGVVVSLGHVQAQHMLRLSRVQAAGRDIAGAVNNGFKELSTAAIETGETTRLVGTLLAAAKNMAPTIRATHALVLQGRELLAPLLPASVTQAADAAIHRDATGLSSSQAAAFLGLNDDLEGLGPDIIGGTGATGEYLPVPAPVEGSPGIAPMTRPMRALRIGHEDTGENPVVTRVTRPDIAPEDVPPPLFELWDTLGSLVGTLAQEYKATQLLARELGKLSRMLRAVDAGIGYGVTALNAVNKSANVLHEIAGKYNAPLAPEASFPSSTQAWAPNESAPGSGPHIIADKDAPAPGSLRATDLLSPNVFGDGVDFPTVGDEPEK